MGAIPVGLTPHLCLWGKLDLQVAKCRVVKLFVHNKACWICVIGLLNIRYIGKLDWTLLVLAGFLQTTVIRDGQLLYSHCPAEDLNLYKSSCEICHKTYYKLSQLGKVI